MRGKSSQISHSIQARLLKKRENTAKSGSCGITDYGRKEGDVEPLRTNQQAAARLIAEEREVWTGDPF